MPAKQYSEKLKQVPADPNYYLSLLESGKENLKSDKAYEKSKAVTNSLLNISFSPLPTLELVVDYVLPQCQDITNLSLQKSLYYIQGFYYAFW